MKRALCFTMYAAFAAGAWLLQGCAVSGSPDYDSRFGEAARALHAQQLIDPDAPTRNVNAIPPVDGRSLREAHDRYIDSFAAPPQPTVVNIGVVGGK